ncbi:hypothetical protein pkur_cds_218 [Pandoravirus kuranda]|uniref:Uncharacterized protein n=1 Tax=Pandoravirus kuranda TaxID=3019033 RepID=A0AA95EEA7_9VIRU|nr:hypothetical protein pkur_cds_218 [Pandoravirus kuranda]
MEAFALDPVDEMCARVRARWAAADRRRANAAWWCPDTATVPRTPPHVLMGALANEFDAYAAHRHAIDTASQHAQPIADANPVSSCPRSGIVPPVGHVSSSTQPSSLAGRRVWVAVAISAAAIVLLIALVGLALAPSMRARADGRNDRDDDDDAESDGTHDMRALNGTMQIGTIRGRGDV